MADVDRVTVRYGHPLELMADLRAMGETNVLVERPPAPLSRAILARACEIYVARFGGPGGRAGLRDLRDHHPDRLGAASRASPSR